MLLALLWISLAMAQTPLALADARFAAGDFAAAEVDYRQYYAENPRGPLAAHALYRTGESAAAQGDILGSIDAFEAFVQQYPADDRAIRLRYRLGLHHARSLQLERAILHFEAFAKARPEDPLVGSAWRRVAEAQEALGNGVQASKAYECAAAASREPSERDALRWRAATAPSGPNPAAMAAFHRISAEPGHRRIDALAAIAAYSPIEDQDAAWQAVLRAWEAAPDVGLTETGALAVTHAVASVFWEELRLLREDPTPDALARFVERTAPHPNGAGLYGVPELELIAGLAYLEIGLRGGVAASQERETAMWHLRQVLRDPSPWTPIKQRAADTLHGLDPGRWPRVYMESLPEIPLPAGPGRDAALAAVRADPADADALAAFGFAALREGDLPMARFVAALAAEEPGGEHHAALLELRARVDLRGEGHSGVGVLLDRALQADPSRDTARALRAAVQLQYQAGSERALRTLEPVRAGLAARSGAGLDPQPELTTALLTLLGVAERRLGRPEAANAALSLAVSMPSAGLRSRCAMAALRRQHPVADDPEAADRFFVACSAEGGEVLGWDEGDIERVRGW